MFEAAILLSSCLLLFCLFYVRLLQKSFVLSPRIVMFEAVIMLSCWLIVCCFHCLMRSHLVRVLCLVLGLWCLKR